MKSLILATITLLGSASALRQAEGDFTAATFKCGKLITANSRCEYFKCLATASQLEASDAIAERWCSSEDADQPLISLDHDPLSSKKKLDAMIAESKSKSIALKRSRQGTPPKDGKILSHHSLASPCGFSGGSEEDLRAHLHDAAMAVYHQRAHETYSENMKKRWIGIRDHVCPPAAPRYSDCSSSVTWEYWTVFGNGTDFVNGEHWKAGYTGTMTDHGVNVPLNTTDLKVGDAIFYYHPMHHVAIYVGDGKVVSHGYDPAQWAAWDYPGRSQVDWARRYIGGSPGPSPPAPPAPAPAGGCYQVWPDLCPGNDNCMCSTRAGCVVGLNASHFTTATNYCAGKCYEVIRDQCPGNFNCVKLGNLC